MAGKAKYQKTIIPLKNKSVAVYAAHKKTHSALEAINEMSLFEGIKMVDLLEVLYEQGKKDGARSVLEAIGDKVEEVSKQIPHKNPGQPKKK